MRSAQVLNPVLEFLKIETAESTQVEQVSHDLGQCVLTSISFPQSEVLHPFFIIVKPSVVLNLYSLSKHSNVGGEVVGGEVVGGEVVGGEVVGVEVVGGEVVGGEVVGGEVVGGEVVGDDVSGVQRSHVALHVLATL